MTRNERDANDEEEDSRKCEGVRYTTQGMSADGARIIGDLSCRTILHGFLHALGHADDLAAGPDDAPRCAEMPRIDIGVVLSPD